MLPLYISSPASRWRRFHFRSPPRRLGQLSLSLCLIASLIFTGFIYFRISSSEQKPSSEQKEDEFPQQDVKNAQEDALEREFNVIQEPHVQNVPKDETTEPSIPDSSLVVRPSIPERRAAVLEAMRHAWKAYKEFAWGTDFLKPVSRRGDQWFNLGLTIVDSLDTLWLMGMKKEFEEGREWVAKEMNLNNNHKDVSVFETTIRVLGGLLSAYHLSGDELFKEKAIDLGKRLLPAFNTRSGFPVPSTNLASLRPTTHMEGSTAEGTTIQLEFRELSRISGNSSFAAAVDKVSTLVHGLEKLEGLVPIFFNIEDGKFRRRSQISLGARGDSYYEYLLKQWLQSGKTERVFLDDFLTSVAGIQTRLLRRSEPSKLLFVAELDSNEAYYDKMDHLVCFYPGSLALAVREGAFGEMDEKTRKLAPMALHHLTVAEELADTCHRMYTQSPIGLAPEITHFNVNPKYSSDLIVRRNDVHNLLRPEAVEAFYMLHQVTGNSTYQDWAWDVFVAFNKSSRVATGGFAHMYDVMSRKAPVFQDKMDSYFLAETLKYLFLMMTPEGEDSPLDLDKWVLNTEAHPLPIHPK